MNRQEIKNKIFAYFKQITATVRANPRQAQQFQLGQIDGFVLPPQENQNRASWETDAIHSIIREIASEFSTSGFIYFGKSMSSEGYPWFTITEYGLNVFESEDVLPYDPDGYIRALQAKIPTLDEITLDYIGEAVSTFNRHQLLSATLTLGVASENVMLLLIEAYLHWLSTIDAARKTRLENKIADRGIYYQYKEFKKEFANDISSLPSQLQNNWETYLEGIFNFIRLNRNNVGHPTGTELESNVINANLQVFASYAKYVFDLINHYT